LPSSFPEPQESSKVVSRWLARLIAGECSPHEVLPLAREAGFPSFADLCLAALPERLPRVPFTREVIRARVGDALAGRLTFGELRAWAEELHAISFQHVLGRDLGERRLAASALALVAVAADDRVFTTRAPVEAVLAALLGSLERRAEVPLAELHAGLFEGQVRLHLATRRPTISPLTTEDGDRADAVVEPLDPSWADVCARPEPGRISTSDQNPIVAFSVVTAAAAQEDALDRYAPTFGLIAEARRRAPNFDVARFRPRIQRDLDGIEEIVLRTGVIDEAAVAYAAKLFALVHGVGSVTLDGKPLRTLRVS
jgi:hypothetical protein